jgi:uncharacterized protein YoxC
MFVIELARRIFFLVDVSSKKKGVNSASSNICELQNSVKELWNPLFRRQSHNILNKSFNKFNGVIVLPIMCACASDIWAHDVGL